MSEVDDYLNTPMGSVPEPAKLPPGTYIGRIKKHKVGERKAFDSDDKIGVLQLFVQPIQADKDVDPDLVAAMDITKEIVFPEWRLDPRGKKSFDTFLNRMFGENRQEAKISAYLPLLEGKQVVFKVVHTEGIDRQSGEPTVFVNIKEVKPFE